MYARNLLEKSSLLTRVVTQGTDDMAERPHFICRPREAQQALVQDAKAFSFPQDSEVKIATRLAAERCAVPGRTG